MSKSGAAWPLESPWLVKYPSLDDNAHPLRLFRAVMIAPAKARILVKALVAIALLQLLCWRIYPQRYAFISPPAPAPLSAESLRPYNDDRWGFLPIAEAKDVCQAHDFEVYPHRTSPRKIFDLVIVNTELDWLEIRLNEMHHHVDYFIIVESASTFTGLKKPELVKENWDRFKPFHHQMIRHTFNDTALQNKTAMEYEIPQRNSMFDQVFPTLSGAQKPVIGDVILVSDVDEIPRPSTLTALRNCAIPRRVTLESIFYYFGFQWRRRENWAFPQATFYDGARTLPPQLVRFGGDDVPERDNGFIYNASWHCSFCFSTLGEMVSKIKSFSHQDMFDKPEFVDRAALLNNVRTGHDPFDREDQIYDRVQGNTDFPWFLKANPERFAYMLDRDPPNANFRDYTAPE